MIGLSLAMLPADTPAQARDLFLDLQERFALTACELQVETALFPAALPPGDEGARAIGQSLRQAVTVLGVHLPYLDINPVSRSPRMAAASRDVLLDAIDFAAATGADYAVLHVRQGSLAGAGAARVAEWQPIVADLHRQATARGVRLLLENADDLRRFADVTALATAAGVDLCLDIGHLYERCYETADWGVAQRIGARLQDILSPWPFLLKAQLPAGETGGVAGALAALGGRLGCLHLHNHDGRSAHRPLCRGKVPWRQLAGHADRLRAVPVILEADYRQCGRAVLESDLRAASQLLAGG